MLLEHPGWIGLWVVLFLGLGWAGWDVRLRQVGELPAARREQAVPARPVKDGPFDMMELAGGSFLMGSAEGDDWADRNDWSKVNERPQHRVTVGGFRIGRTPVTQRQWREVMGLEDRSQGDDDLPVTEVSWYRALEFCNALSRSTGYRPCYRQSGFWRLKRWVCDWSADGYRLPTEAEWEYACRAETESPWSHGDDPKALGDYAWYEGNAGGTVHTVAQKRPNPWRLYDMHGNVWEWCWDRYGPYRKRATENPRGSGGGWFAGGRGFGLSWILHSLKFSLILILQGRVLRGGSFVSSPEVLRSAGRVGPLGWDGGVGFRCVRVPARRR